MKTGNPIYDTCVELFRQGTTIKELSERFGIAPERIRAAIKNRRISTAQIRRSVSGQQARKEMARLRKQLSADRLRYAELRIEWMRLHGPLNELEQLEIYADARDEQHVSRETDVLEKALGRRERRRFGLSAEATWHSPLHEVSYGRGQQ